MGSKTKEKFRQLLLPDREEEHGSPEPGVPCLPLPLPRPHLLRTAQKTREQRQFSFQASDATYWQEGLAWGLPALEQGKVIKGEGIIKDETQISVQMTGCAVMLFSEVGKLTAPGLGGGGGGYFFFF